MTIIENDFFIEFEQEVLGSLLLKGDLKLIINFLNEKHFIDPVHSEVFRAIKLAYERFNIINPLLVKKVMNAEIISNFETKTKTPFTIYITNLLTLASAISSEVINAARRVVQQWARIQISKVAKKLALQTSDPSCNTITITRKAMQNFEDIISEFQLSNTQCTRSSCTSIANAATTAMKLATKQENESEYPNITWGLKKIDHLMGGVQLRELTLIGARPSMGKTTFALSIALHMAMSGHGVAFFSLEMDREKLGARAISNLLYQSPSQIPYINLIRGEITQEQHRVFHKICKKLQDFPLIIDDRPFPGIVEIRTRSEQIAEQAQKSSKNLQVIIIDHLGLIRPSNRYQGNRIYEIAEITASLKMLARELNVAIILLSQLNRSVETRMNKVPQLSDLRDSGAIEQDADTIAFLYREAYYLARETGGTSDDIFERRDKLENNEKKMDFIIAKQRNGPIESFSLFADMPHSIIKDEK
ncbi:AAA family ATPase [Candidatus Liberibacter africanus]|uniref:DNA 5'-3' helicase n=1 Tax=Candidatus Liberibacter africanus PTSAPSY TaxID=1277257 RepID=A0A0G3I5G2_LIBAF|nr:DnaB-like helicase C-terminal domain-containing protein [Candidatus Liberibacter africanus]AKK19703.1 replicative DNA helicase [Candidatus Liberibacter africanus PTSAPSY]QTP63587.1 AAA family ATPase [Candidatus Liberibacter africanus]